MRCLFLATLIAISLLTASAKPTFRILALGDSITQGEAVGQLD